MLWYQEHLQSWPGFFGLCFVFGFLFVCLFGFVLTPSNLTPSHVVCCSFKLNWICQNFVLKQVTLFFCSVTGFFLAIFFGLFRLTYETTIFWSTSSTVIVPAHLNHPAYSVCLRIYSKWLRWFPKDVPYDTYLIYISLHFHYCLQNNKGSIQVLFLKEIMLRTSHCINASDAQGCW